MQSGLDNKNGHRKKFLKFHLQLPTTFTYVWFSATVIVVCTQCYMVPMTITVVPNEHVQGGGSL